MESHYQTELPLSPGSENDTTHPVYEREPHDSDPFTLSRDSSILPKQAPPDPLHHTIPSPEYHSSSSSHLSGDFADDDEYDYGGRDGASSRSSISSLPGSVVVYPPGKMHGLPFLPHRDDPNLTIGAARTNKTRPPKYASKVRERNSPFRHPSSVLAMQMGEEEALESDYSTPSTRKGWRKEKGFVQSPSFSDRSVVSHGSIKGSPYLHHGHRSSPRAMAHHAEHDRNQAQQQQPQQVQKEYPLVLLHCTLLSPSLSLPQGLGKPSHQLLKEVLPAKYWQRWKLLDDKIVGSGIIRDRGVLISHPQEAYDLLEERLLESLELVKPRLADGHFMGGDETEDEKEQQSHDNNDTTSGRIDENEHKCPDCGGSVSPDERKWDVRVYAANGLMRAGAWAAAWREMEKVDVEVSVSLPSEVRQELESRISEDEHLKLEAERHLTEEEQRLREIYGDPMGPSQEEIDGLVDGEDYDSPYTPEHQTDPTDSHGHDIASPAEGPHEQEMRKDVNLRTALWNYLRILANDPRNAALFFLGVLVAFLAVNMRATETASDVTVHEKPLHTPLAQTLEYYATTATAASATVIPSEDTVSSYSEPEHSEITAPPLQSSAANEPDHDSDPNEGKEVPGSPMPEASDPLSSDDTGDELSPAQKAGSDQELESSQSTETSENPIPHASDILPNEQENIERVEETNPTSSLVDAEPSQQQPLVDSEEV